MESVLSASVHQEEKQESVREVFEYMCNLKRLNSNLDSFLFYTVRLPGRRLADCNEEVQKSLTKFTQEVKSELETIQRFQLPCQRYTDTLELCTLAFSKDIDVGLQIHLLEKVLDLYQSLLEEEGKEDLLKAFTDDFKCNTCKEPCSKKRKL